MFSPTYFEIPIGATPKPCIGHEIGGTCGQLIYFAFNPATGRSTPVSIACEGGRAPDPKRDPNQNDLFAAPQGEPQPGRGISHWNDCPDVTLIRRHMMRQHEEATTR